MIKEDEFNSMKNRLSADKERKGILTRQIEDRASAVDLISMLEDVMHLSSDGEPGSISYMTIRDESAGKNYELTNQQVYILAGMVNRYLEGQMPAEKGNHE